VGISVLPAETRNGEPLPERLVLAPQLPAGWTWLKIRNLKWHDVTADVSITRDAAGLSIAVAPRGGTLPIELHAILPPGSRQLTRDLHWRPVEPGGDASRGLRLWRMESVSAPATFSLRAAPGIQAAPIHVPLLHGDTSSRLRVIDATLDGNTYTLRVEGRRGRSYRLRLFAPRAITVSGARVVADEAADGAGRTPGTVILQVDMPPAEPVVSGTGPRRAGWATASIAVQVGNRPR
jgi:hypothetical protein